MSNNNGRGKGFEEAGNTRLSIELKINGRLEQKIDAVNVGMVGNNMVFAVKNDDVEFNHNQNRDYIDAFKTMFTRLENGRA